MSYREQGWNENDENVETHKKKPNVRNENDGSFKEFPKTSEKY